MRRRRRIFTLLVLTFIILVGLFCFSNLANNAKTDLEIDQAEIVYETKENEIYASYNKNLIISNGSIVKVVNKKGKEQLQTKFYSSNLSIQTNNKFALLADLDGGEILLLNKNKIACHKIETTTEKLLFTKLLDNGDFIVGLTSSIEVYNKKGEQRIKKTIDYYALDAVISKKKLVASGFSIKEKTATGLIIYYDMTTGNEIKRFEKENEVFPEVKEKSNKIIAINENKIVIQKSNFEEAEIKFASKTLEHYYITNLGKIICLFNDGGEQTVWEAYSLTGELRKRETIDMNIKSFIYSNNGFSLIGDDNIQIYNTFGWLRKMTKIDKNIVGVAKSGIYIIENSEIKYIKL